MTLAILTAPDPRLRRKAEPVASVDADVVQLMDDMLETMRRAKGVGLAAIQVGVAKRVIVAEVAGPDGAKTVLQMANPEIVKSSEETAEREEGCLSVPGQSASVRRPARVTVRHLARDGATREIAVEGLLAACLQHEIDHLDGRLYIDRLPPVKRDMMLRRAKKLRAREAGAR